MSKNVGKVFNLTGGGFGGSLKLQELTVANPPTKTVYKSGESFDPTGMVVTAGYGYGLASDVTGYTITPSVLTDGVTEVMVAYTENRVTKTVSIPVTVEKVLAAIVVTTPPSKTVYQYLESFNPSGMVVSAVFSDGSRVEVSGYSFSTSAFTALGKQAVSLRYTYEGVTKSVNLEVTVNAISVSVPVQNGTLSYTGGAQIPSWNGYDANKMTLSGITSGTNAGEYIAQFTLAYGYVFPNGSSKSEARWRIGRAVIAAVPTQSGALIADGSPKSPSWNGYDESKMTIGGTLTGTSAGNHTASFTPTANYQWWDGSTGAKNAVWVIASLIVPIPTQRGSLTYTGAVQTPSWNNFDTENCTVSVTGASDAGEHTATFTLLKGMWSDGTTTAKTVKWIIGRATIAAVPAQSGTLKYDGNPHTPTWNSNYDPIKMVVSVVAKINAGTDYTASFTPTANYQWWDGSIGAKTVTWSISKGNNTLSVSPASITFDTSTKSKKITVTRNGSGKITATSSDTSVATVGTINQNTGEVTINSVNDTSGSAVITIKVAEDSNYLAPANKTMNVTAQFATIYGVEWNWEKGSSTKGVRTDAAANFPDPSPAVNNGSGSSPFDDLMPWAGMVKETRAGGVEVKEPKYWFKWTKTGKKLKLQIADGPVEGFHVDPVNMDRGDGLGELDFCYIGRYHCNASGMSNAGMSLRCSNTRSSARTEIHNLGANFWQMDFAQIWYVGMLYLVEFADWNGQATIGYGCAPINENAAVTSGNGKTSPMQYHTGTTAANRTTYGYTQYRNIESWWDNIYDWVDGCYCNANGLHVILNPNQFSDDANGTLIGSIPSVGYPDEMIVPTQEGFEWALIPATTGGSDSTCVPDLWSLNTNGPCLCHGGSAYNKKPQSGPFCIFNRLKDLGASDCGCRLQERPPKEA